MTDVIVNKERVYATIEETINVLVKSIAHVENLLATETFQQNSHNLGVIYCNTCFHNNTRKWLFSYVI